MTSRTKVVTLKTDNRQLNTYRINRPVYEALFPPEDDALSRLSLSHKKYRVMKVVKLLIFASIVASASAAIGELVVVKSILIFTFPLTTSLLF